MYNIVTLSEDTEHLRRKRTKKTKEEKKERRDAAKLILANPYLLALKPAMRKALDKRGIKHDGKLPDIVEKFYYNIVKRQNFENYQHSDHLAAEVVEGIISGIIGFFKSLRDKKKSGAPLSDTEQTLLDTAETGADKYEEIKKEEINEGIGAFLTSPIFLIIAVFLLLKVFKVF